VTEKSQKPDSSFTGIMEPGTSCSIDQNVGDKNDRFNTTNFQKLLLDIHEKPKV
jgi:hypothetical protein